jgi:hypothetical protein
MKKRLIFSALLVTMLIVDAKAQDSTLTTYKQNSTGATKAANDFKTGQANDIITNFYKVAIKNIFGSKKEVSYSTTIFGLIDSLDHKFAIDSFYKKTRWARNIELSVSGKIDSANHVTDFGGGVKIYLLNKRDITTEDKSFNSTMEKNELEINNDLSTVKKKLRLAHNIDPKVLIKLMSSFTKFAKSKDYHDLEPQIIDTLIKMDSRLVKGIGLAKIADQFFAETVEKIKKRPLWSLAGNYDHATNNKTDTVIIESKFLVGLNWKGDAEFNVTSNLKLFNNTENRDLSAQKFHFETGLNWILHKNSNGKSQEEFKFFGSYDKGFNASKTIPTATMANATYRYRVQQLGGFWVPVTLSYDPGKGKFLGFIDITINIDPISKSSSAN